MNIALHSLKYGLWLGFFISAGTQVLTWIGLGLTNWFVLLTYLLVIVFGFVSTRKWWVNHHRSVTFLQVFLLCLILVVVSRYVFQGYMYIYTRYIDPEWINEVATIYSDMLRENNLSDSVIEVRIVAFRQSYKATSMFTFEIIRYGISQWVFCVLASIIFVFKSRKGVNLRKD